MAVNLANPMGLFDLRGLFNVVVDQKVTGLLSFTYCFGQPSRLHPSPGPCFAMWSQIFWSNLSTRRSSPLSPAGSVSIINNQTAAG